MRAAAAIVAPTPALPEAAAGDATFCCSVKAFSARLMVLDDSCVELFTIRILCKASRLRRGRLSCSLSAGVAFLSASKTLCGTVAAIFSSAWMSTQSASKQPPQTRPLAQLRMSTQSDRRTAPAPSWLLGKMSSACCVAHHCWRSRRRHRLFRHPPMFFGRDQADDVVQILHGDVPARLEPRDVHDLLSSPRDKHD